MKSSPESVSLWVDQGDLKSFPSLSEDKSADVCIVGAGIAGLTTAYLLAKSGKKTIVLDSGPVAGGQTSRTSAHLASILDDGYCSLEHYFGADGARLATQSHQDAIDFIASLVRSADIDCDFDYVDGYIFAGSSKGGDELHQELQAMHRAGLLDVKMIARAPLDYDTGPALYLPKQAQFSPLPYVNRLADLIVQLDGAIHSNTHVNAVDEDVVQSDKGYRVKAKDIVIATNVPVHNRYFPHFKQAAYRSYLIAGKIPKASVKKALYYDNLDPYHYVRVIEEQGHDLLLVGGQDHRTGQSRDAAANYGKLHRWAKIRFPMLSDIQYRWSGQIIEPIDGLAFIGRAEKNIYIICGDSGHGLTHGTLGLSSSRLSLCYQWNGPKWASDHMPRC